MVEVVHVMPGRIRLRWPDLKSNPALRQHLSERLRALTSVREVQISEKTGSILLLHAADVDHELWERLTEIFSDLHVSDFFRRARAFAEDTASRSVRVSPMAELRHWLKTAATRAENRQSKAQDFALPAFLAVMGLAKLFRGLVTDNKMPLPAWYDLLWYALCTYKGAQEEVFEDEVREFRQEMRQFANGNHQTNGKSPT